MASSDASLSLGELAALVGGRLEGDPSVEIRAPIDLGQQDPHGVAFAETAELAEKLQGVQIGGVLLPEGVEAPGHNVVRVGAVRQAFALVLAHFHRDQSLPAGVHPLAVVDPSALVDPSASIGPFSVVGQQATIAAGARIHAGCFVGDWCGVGIDTVLFPGVVLYPRTVIGARCRVHSGAVLGADGFGYVWDGNRRVKIPHAGGVRIDEDVEIGANTCIDRAMVGETHLAEGVKLDDLVMVGHNVKLGRHTVVAGQAGFAGSSKAGERCVLAGQVGVRDHSELADDVHLGGQAGVVDGYLPPGEYLGSPALPARQAMRIWMANAKLLELLQRVRELERQVRELAESK